MNGDQPISLTKSPFHDQVHALHRFGGGLAAFWHARCRFAKDAIELSVSSYSYQTNGGGNRLGFVRYVRGIKETNETHRHTSSRTDANKVKQQIIK